MTKEAILHTLHTYYQKNRSRYGLIRLGIFGSIARGTQTETSDLDVVVELEKPDLFILADIKQDIESLCNLKVDILRNRPTLGIFLKNRIAKEVVYV